MKQIQKESGKRLPGGRLWIAVFVLCLGLCLSGLTHVAAEDIMTKGGGTVDVDSLSIMSSTGSNGQVLGTFSRGDTFLVTGTTGDWVEIIYQGGTGYVKYDSVTLQTNMTDSFESAGTPDVNGSGVNLRTGPSTDYESLGLFYSGMSCKVTGVAGDWIGLKIGNASGYMRSDFVSFSKSSESGSSGGSGSEGTGGTSSGIVSSREAAQIIWDYFIDKGMTEQGVSGMMGNLYAESGLITNNLENYFESELGYTDSTYTSAVDSGFYSRDKFIDDSAGYGLCQWTAPSRKAGLYDLARSRKVSISDLNMQIDFLWQELSTNYTGVLNVLMTTKNVKEASDVFMCNFENPYDQSADAKNDRASIGYSVYYTYGTPGNSVTTTQATIYAQSGGGNAQRTVAEGTYLEIVDNSGRWSQLSDGSWIDSQYVFVFGSTAALNSIKVGTGTASGSIKVYEEPYEDAKVITTLASGTKRNVYGVSGNWYQILWGGKYYWVRNKDMSFTAVDPLSTGIVTAATSLCRVKGDNGTKWVSGGEGDIIRIYSRSNGWIGTYLDGRYVYLEEQYVYDTTTPNPAVSDKIGQGTTTKKVTVYSRPGGGNVVCTLAADRVRNLYAQSGNWYQIYVTNYGFCWVRCDGFSYTRANTNVSYAVGTLSASVQTYYGPGYAYDPSIVIPSGAKCNIYRQSGNWYLVYKSGKYLWIPADAVSVTLK